MRRLPAWLRLLLGNAAVFVLLLIFVEGASSLVLFVRQAQWQAPVSERLHTQYDAELGWVNLPKVRIPDMYGRGVGLSTNSRGFRGARDVEETVPPGKRRIVCSGDSFAFGWGVADEDVWCHQLELLDPSRETVNLGLGGYGIDQAYLRYRRDGAALQHTLHIFAFITEDFRRMRLAEFLTYGKPWLALDGEQIVVRNVPVPRISYSPLSWLFRNVETFRFLRTVDLAHRITGRGVRQPQSREVTTVDATRRLVPHVFADLERLTAQRGSDLVLVLFPAAYEFDRPDPDGWADYLTTLTRELDIPFLNLFGPLRDLEPERRRAMYLRPGSSEFAGASAHFSAAGNRFVAEHISAYLNRVP
jgi:hypothetical protein